jgi:hypothetical protein
VDDLVAAHGGTEPMPADHVEGHLGEHPLAVGHQGHRYPGHLDRLERRAGTGPPPHPVGEQGGGAGDEVRAGVGEPRRGGLDAGLLDQHAGRGAQLGTDDGGARARAELTAEPAGGVGERDVPHLLGVDEGAVQVPEDGGGLASVGLRKVAFLQRGCVKVAFLQHGVISRH